MVLLGLLGLLLAGVVLGGCARALPLGLRAWVLPLPALGAFALIAWAGSAVVAGTPVRLDAAWVPQLDLTLALQLHGMGLLLGLLVTGIGTLILLYATGYLGPHEQANRLYAYLYAFMFAMAGLAVADHLLLFFIFWELTSITSYLLIGFQHREEGSRKNALQALLVTGLGGMALLAGLIILAQVSGTWLLSELPPLHETIVAHPAYGAILVLVLVGAFTKSAQFPFHFWLPNAMAAPTPVSAYLHSATMVKAGVFLLALMMPILGGTLAWTAALTSAGGVTLLLGGLYGFRQHDLKRILAGTTVAVLGFLTLLLGIGSEKAVLAALLFLLGHALYKATLFMVAGSIDHETGTRDTRLLGGLKRAMPWTAVAAALAALSKMGLPPFFGFLGKEYTYKASLAVELQWTLTALLILGNAMLLALAVRAAILPFFGPGKEELPKQAHEAPWSMRIGPLLLAVLGALFGFVPHLLDPLLAVAKETVLGYPTEPNVKLWAGFNLPLLLSAVTIVVGFILLEHKDRAARLLNAVPLPGAERAYDGIFAAVLAFSRWQTRLLQSGYLRRYILTILVATVALTLYKLARFGWLPDLTFTQPVNVTMAVTAAVMLGGIFLAVTASSRLTVLISLGVVGFGVALIFAQYSAPDLAITQILVETLTVVLFAWVVHRLPAYRSYSGRASRLFDVAVAGGCGLLVAALVLKSKVVDFGGEVSETLAAWSQPEAHGANVVNVILVDFRALDTWGEISVLAIAALGVWALLASRSTKEEGT